VLLLKLRNLENTSKEKNYIYLQLQSYANNVFREKNKEKKINVNKKSTFQHTIKQSEKKRKELVKKIPTYYPFKKIYLFMRHSVRFL